LLDKSQSENERFFIVTQGGLWQQLCMTARPPSNFLQRTQGARKIIVVDLGFLGDSIHLVPALWELQRCYPGAELHTLSAVLGAEALQLAPCVTRPWAFPLTPDSPPWWRHWGLIAALRRQRFDVAYNFSGADRTIFMTALTGAPHRVAHAGGREHFWNRWLIPDWVPRQERSLPVFEQRRQVLAACGFRLQPARFDLRIPEEASQWARQNVPTPAAHISINASGPEKEWPLDRWIALTQTLLQNQRQLSIIATAGAKTRERERVAALRAAVKHPRFLDFESLSIARFAALLQRCQLHIGADSGALHLAMALGVPTLGVFRQYEGLNEWLPRGPAHHNLIAASLDAISSEAISDEALGMIMAKDGHP
jgi:ADP-heptose:LPS heptosyltransferase